MCIATPLANLTKAGMERIENLVKQFNERDRLEALKLAPNHAEVVKRDLPGTPKFSTKLDTGIED